MNKTLRILIVDDDCSMTRTLSDILRFTGYDTEIAHSGAEALEKLDLSFDYIISDIKMPDMNGVELCRAIKARQPETPVILMTAYSADSLIQEGLAAGVLSILTKPLDIEKLLKLLTG